MAFILHDRILDSLICDLCNKYLSVLPVEIFSNRRIKCGRCVRNEKVVDAVAAVSLFGLVADKCLFKCVNRFDGCREVLFHSQVQEHERKCISKIYRCPICPPSEELSSLSLEQHFRKKHGQSVLKFPEFSLKLSEISSELTELFLYRLEESLFFITFKYSQSEDIMQFNVSLVGSPEQATDIIQQFWISDDEEEISTEKKPCTSFELENDWFCIKPLNMDDKSITIKFELEIIHPQFIRITSRADVHCSDQESNELFTSPSLTTRVIGLPFEPMVVQYKLRKIHFLKEFSDVSLSPCGTAIVYFNRLVFLQCINCHIICGVGDIRYWYLCNTDTEHSLCNFCYHFLRCHNYIREECYSEEQPFQHFKMNIQFSCKWECGKKFIGKYLNEHEEFCTSLEHRACFLPSCNFLETPSKNIKEHYSEEHNTKQNFLIGHHYYGRLSIGRIVLLADNQFVFIDIDEQSHSRRQIKIKSHTDAKLVAFLFDGLKRFLKKFVDKISMRSTENNYYLKIIVPKQNDNVAIA